ncbi:TonB-dependent receptor [Flavobacteriaceae bacterium GF1]
MKNALTVFFLIILTNFAAGQTKVSGTVLDTGGTPLLGATIQLRGTQIGVIADENGFFELNNLKSGNYELIVSSLGYQTRSVPLDISRNQSLSLEIKLTESSQELNEVVVKGKSNAQRKREEPIKIEVIGVSKILEQATSVPEMINQTSGVKVRQSSGIGSNTTININGLQGNAVRFFRDGVPIDYLGRAFNIGLVPTGSIQNLEIYKGVLPVELGADALGGAINLVSRRKDKEYLDLSYEAGSFNTHIINLGANVIIPNTKIHVGVNSYYTGSDNDYEFELETAINGVTDVFTVNRFHDGIAATFFEVNAGVHQTKFADVLDFSFGYFTLDNEVQNGISIDQPLGEVTEEEINRIFSVSYKKNILPNWNLDIFGALSKVDSKEQDLATNRYEWDGDVQRDFNGNPIITPGGEFVRRDQRIEEESKVARVFTRYDVNDAIRINLSSTYNSFDRVGSDPFQIPNVVTGIQPITIPSTYTKIVSGLGVGLSFFEGKLQSESFVKNYYLEAEAASLNFSDNLTQDLFFRDFGWGQSFKYAFDDDTYVRISFEDAIRIPDAEEYVGDNLFVQPNLELLPERSENLNVGFASNLNATKTLFTEVNVFYRNNKDFIQLVPLNLITSEYQNTDRQEVIGVEGNLRINIGENSSIRGAVTFQDLRTRESVLNPNLIDARTPNIPYYFTNLSANKEFMAPFGWENAKLNLYGNYLYTEQYLVRPVNRELEPDLFGSVPNNIRDFVIPSQHQVNMGLTCTFNDWPVSLNFEAINVLDNVLFDDFRIPKPLRNYRFKMTYRL